MAKVSIYRKINTESYKGYDNGVVDVAFQLFSCGMVWDGNLSSKSGRDYLVKHGFAVKSGDGYQAMTGKGTIAFLLHPHTWIGYYRKHKRWGRAFTATPEQIKRAMD